jgi:hypothetical protein
MNHRKRLSTIFSPSSEDRDEDTRIEDEATSEQDSPASPKPRKWFSSKTANSRMIQNSEDSYTLASIRIHGSVQDSTETPESKSIRAVASPDVQTEVPARKNSMGDMIKFYDGSSGKVVQKSNSYLRLLGLTDNEL